MEIIKIENLNFRYPGREKDALNNINIHISQGDFVTLCGKSGCGKTTLLRLLKPPVAPIGNINGRIHCFGKPLEEFNLKEQASMIGFVMQNPDSQIVTDKVWHELAFGPESLGYSNNEIRIKVAEMASFFGIENWFYKNTNELSGGQKQILNLASVMVMQPKILILDEPTSQLDPIASLEFIKILGKINRELGTTVIISEHRLQETFPISHKVIVMDEGRIIADGTPKQVGKTITDTNSDMYYALPAPMRIYSKISGGYDYPITVREGRLWLEEYCKNKSAVYDIPADDKFEEREDLIELKNVYFRYEKNSPDILKDFNLSIKRGEIFAIMGGNGIGKTTALSAIAGIITPYRGTILINKKNILKIDNLYSKTIGILPQNTETLLVKKNVYEDLCDGLSQFKISEEEMTKKIKSVVNLCKIDDLLSFHPYDLSGGEKQRVALAKVLLKSPEILLLDEPTKGLDPHFKCVFAEILKELKKNNTTTIMVSHDIEFCAEYTDRCALMFDGSCICVDTPHNFFKNKSFYTTSTNRMARNIFPDAVLARDIIFAYGKKF